jgi:hypothetical protein
MGKRDVIAPVGGILGPVSPCQIRGQDNERDKLTPAGGRHAIHVYLLSPRSLIDPRVAFAEELLQVQEPKAEQLEPLEARL